MERRRLQHQRMKQQQQQQQQRFCISQQDLTEAITQMKPTIDSFHVRRHVTHKSLINISSSMETLDDNRTVSQLINDFEARTRAQDLLPIINDVISNRVESNCSHMSIRTMKIKGNCNENDIINNDVCSPISHSIINDDNQIVTVGIHRHQLTDDKEQEKNDDEVIHQTLDSDSHKQDLPPLSICTIENKNNNNHHQYPIQMLTRSTDIDVAALTLGKRHEVRFHDLITKEAQLNTALADLLSITNDTDKSSSINSSPRSLTVNNEYRSTTGNKNNSISASIDLLNDLLETLDVDNEDFDNKKPKKDIHTYQSSQKNDDNPIKPINMFW